MSRVHRSDDDALNDGGRHAHRLLTDGQHHDVFLPHPHVAAYEPLRYLRAVYRAQIEGCMEPTGMVSVIMRQEIRFAGGADKVKSVYDEQRHDAPDNFDIAQLGCH